MRIYPLLAVGATTLSLLAGCAPPEGPDVVVVDTTPAVAGDACNSAAYQQYVGQRSPAITLPAGSVVRHYRTGDPVTMDMNPARINFEYNRSGTLVAVSCG